MAVHPPASPLVTEGPRSTPARRADGATVWFTGLPSAGKTTIARVVGDRLRAAGRRVEVLDGDEVRTNLTADLGFSRADRETNVRRIGYVARLLARNGVTVLVPVIAPYAASRAAVRAAHAAGSADSGPVPYVEVYVATPLAVCSARDVKGLYARQRAGELSGLTGVDDPYEAPEHPELRLDTDQSIDDAAAVVVEALRERRLA